MHHRVGGATCKYGKPLWIVEDNGYYYFVRLKRGNAARILCSCPTGQRGIRCSHAEEVHNELRLAAGEQLPWSVRRASKRKASKRDGRSTPHPKQPR
jgi:hypothetical protein